MVGGAEGGGSEGGVNHTGQGMTYISGVDSMAAKPRLFEGKEAKQLVDQTAYGFDAALPPGPDLRGNQIEDGDVHFF